MLPAPADFDVPAPPELCKAAALPPPTRSAAEVVSGTPPKSKKRVGFNFEGSQTKVVRQGKNQTYMKDHWKPLKKCTCKSVWCEQLNASPEEVDGLRALVIITYGANIDDYAKRNGGKQFVDKYLGRLLKGIPPEAPKLLPNDPAGNCGYCHQTHSFKHCSFRTRVEAEDETRTPTKFEYFVDNVDPTKVVLRPVCAVTWKSLYNISQDRMATIKKHFVTAPLSNNKIFLQGYTPHDDTATNLHDERLMDLVKAKPFEWSHYINCTSTAATVYFLSGNESQKSFYDEYLELYDKDYKAQCLRMNHMPGYHRKRDEPSDAQYAQDEKKRKLTPSILYSYVRSFFAR